MNAEIGDINYGQNILSQYTNAKAYFVFVKLAMLISTTDIILTERRCGHADTRDYHLCDRRSSHRLRLAELVAVRINNVYTIAQLTVITKINIIAPNALILTLLHQMH